MNAIAPGVTPETAQASAIMLQMIGGYWNTQCVYVAAKLGVADRLQAGPQSADKLAADLNVNADYLYRVLRALAGMGIFEETAERTFRNTPMSTLLAADVPGSMQAMAIMNGEEHYFAWGHLLKAVQTGGFAFEDTYGTPVFEFYEQNPVSGEIFNRAMTNLAANIHSSIIPAYDFSGIKKIVDVGGGHGKLLSNILRHNPHLQGVLFDMPHVVTGAGKHLDEFSGRCEIASGDFFKAVAPGADAYIMSMIIHDWSDELSLRILKNVHAAMQPDGKLLVVDQVVTNSSEPQFAKISDINMMVMTQGGKERTEAEFRQLFASAGFDLTRIIPTQSPVSIVEGVRK